MVPRDDAVLVAAPVRGARAGIRRSRRGRPATGAPSNGSAAVSNASSSTTASARSGRGACTTPKVQRSCAALAEGYGFRIDACPPHHPAEKGVVEAGVKYVKRSFMPLREFRDLADANRQLHWPRNAISNGLKNAFFCLTFSGLNRPRSVVRYTLTRSGYGLKRTAGAVAAYIQRGRMKVRGPYEGQKLEPY